MLLVEDRDLLLAFRRGERTALERVYMEYGAAVASFLKRGFSFQSGSKTCRYGGARSAFDLEDRVHDAFARAFNESARLGYDGLTPYRTYLFTVARNLVIDDFRRKERALVEYTIDEGRDAPQEVDGEATDVLHGELAPSGNPHKDVENAQLLSLVAAFKGELPARERQVFELRFEAEKEHKDIAGETGLSPSKIKTSEQRIREKFFEHLRSHGYLTSFKETKKGWLAAIRGTR